MKERETKSLAVTLRSPFSPPHASGPSLLSIIFVKRALALNTVNDNDFFHNNNLDPREERARASLYILTFKISKLSHNVNTDNKYPRIAHSCPLVGFARLREFEAV